MMQAVLEIDEPIEILLACHARFRMLAAPFRKMTRYEGQAGGEGKVRQAAAQVLQCMAGPFPQHLLDEEDLFDMLVAASPRMMRFETEALVRQLRAGHEQIQRQWQRLRALLARIESGEPVILDAQAISHFMATLETHLGHEESACFPLMQRLLDRQQLMELGLKMRRRRGAR